MMGFIVLSKAGIKKEIKKITYLTSFKPKTYIKIGTHYSKIETQSYEQG